MNKEKEKKRQTNRQNIYWRDRKIDRFMNR